jgi:hypothetical protein
MSEIVPAGNFDTHVAGRFRAHKHKYVFNTPDCAIDGDAVAEQSRKQIKNDPTLQIVVHHHSSGDSCDGSPHDAYGTSLAATIVV